MGSADRPLNHDCDGEVTEGNKDLPAGVLPAGIATDNSNCRLAPHLPGQNRSRPLHQETHSTNPWHAASRTINISQKATLTMGGSDYWVCGLFINNGELIMADGDERADLLRHARELRALRGRHTGAHHRQRQNRLHRLQPGTGNFEVPGLYLQGSPEHPDQSRAERQLRHQRTSLYAPYSDISIGGEATWIGMLAGKSLHMHGNPDIESDPDIALPDTFFSSLWERTGYVECTGATASPPDANC